jgi:hypothetical protein
MTEKQFFLNQGEFVSPHSVILDRLNFWNYNEGRRVYYDLSEFEKALPSLKERPVIFARKHADPKTILSNINDALIAVDGKLVGTSTEISINNTGSPKMCAELDITDPEIDQMIADGKVYLSHAFDGRLDAQNRIYDITGNHILIYPTDTGIPPGDQIATFLNQSSEGLKMAEETKTDDTREFFMNQYQEQVKLASAKNAEVETQKITIQNQGAKIQELEAKVSELTEKAALVEDQTVTIQNQGTKIAELEEKIKVLAVDKLESEKKAFLNQFLPGVQKAFEGRFGEYDDLSQRAFLINDMWKAQAAVPQPPTEPSGEINVLNQEDKPKYLNGVIMEFDANGKPSFREA